MKTAILQEEFLDYFDMGYITLKTEDGSLTLKKNSSDSEPMHSLKGALTESLYIYGEAVDLFLESNSKDSSFDILSLGTGMGYNEIIAFTKLLKSNFFDYNFKSFESETHLVDLFLKRIESPDDFPEYFKLFINSSLFDRKESDSVLFYNTIKSLSEKIEFCGAFNEAYVKSLNYKKYLILFDAYSSKTSESLWTNFFLDKLLKKCAPGSCFATYASTGVLKRALKENSFYNKNKAGFAFKRQSTLAVKL